MMADMKKPIFKIMAIAAAILSILLYWRYKSKA